ncbi:MAG: hypothetical protein H6834_18325 [Planctomycetes bacterium]|nr:hypothetical protein [Planctomycetota bacterium]MCB9892232.1 hypothetical protein [Planctomycetota bacterium]
MKYEAGLGKLHIDLESEFADSGDQLSEIGGSFTVSVVNASNQAFGGAVTGLALQSLVATLNGPDGGSDGGVNEACVAIPLESAAPPGETGVQVDTGNAKTITVSVHLLAYDSLANYKGDVDVDLTIDLS